MGRDVTRDFAEDIIVPVLVLVFESKEQQLWIDGMPEKEKKFKDILSLHSSLDIILRWMGGHLPCIALLCLAVTTLLFFSSLLILFTSFPFIFLFLLRMADWGARTKKKSEDPL